MRPASTGGSVEIIHRYADRLAWWVSEPDRGQAEAINKGMQRASGDVVAWLNSDDLYLPGAVSRAVRALAADTALGIVFGDALTIDPSGRPVNPLVFGPWGLDELIRFRIICQPAVFMRRFVFEQSGYLDPAYHMMLDHHLWIRLAERSQVRYIGGVGGFAPLAAARHHPQAKNTSQPEKFAQETLRVLDWMTTQPDLQHRIARSRRQVYGGAFVWRLVICWTVALIPGRWLCIAVHSSPGLATLLSIGTASTARPGALRGPAGKGPDET